MAAGRSEVNRVEDGKKKINKEGLKNLKGIFGYMKPYRVRFAIGMLLLVVSSTGMLAFPWLTGVLIDVAGGKAAPVSLLDNFNTVGVVLLGIFLVQAVFSFMRVLLFAQVNEKALANLRKDLYNRLMSLPLSFYDSRRTGELMSRISSDISLLSSTFTTVLAELFRQVITLVVGIAIIFVLMPKLSTFMLLIFPFMIVAAIVFGRFIRKLTRETTDLLADTNVVVEETIQSIQVVKAFTSELYEVLRYGKSLDKMVKVALNAAKYRAAFIAFSVFAFMGTASAVIWYGGSLIQSGEISSGDLLTFVLYTGFIGGSIAGLSNIFEQIQRAIGASERVLEILDEEGEMELQAAHEELPRFQGDIRFEGVRFRYPSREEIEVLKGVDLEVRAGEKVALVGHSGAGKSTLVQLLMRFYTQGEGSIVVDGKGIGDYDLLSFRKQLGIVPQEVLLFGGTIEENIAYGKPGASLDEVKDAARKANALRFIENFPEGFDTVVGERGIQLSGGQRQRIAIARAILKDPAILILDEATSSLDAESETLVQEALEELMKGRTTIVIAHRLATIRKVDRIYVLDQGQITESGTHEELTALDEGTYSNLVRLQFQEN